jgi:hypothetical protein
MTKIVVYFETLNFSHAEVVAQFADEELYAVCLPALEKYASENGWVVTESVREDEQVTDKEDNYDD